MLDLERIDRRLLAAAAVVIVICFLAGIKYGEIRSASKQDKDKSLDELKVSEEKAEPAADYIQVYVTGQVETPRVVKLKTGARVIDAVEQVKLLPDADIKNINMARLLQDGEAVVIPGPEAELQSLPNNSGLTASASASASGTNQGLVNINTAAVSEMDDRLPGIGPALAQRIADYRTANGPFASIEDIKNVSGIGDKKFEDMKSLITVR